MSGISRRRFLVQIASAAAAIGAVRVIPGSTLSSGSRPFEILVVGDSLMSAQGLRPEHKFSWLVKEWLEKDFFEGKRAVNYKSKAHSGARIRLHEDEASIMRKLGDDETRFHHPEVNLSYPCIATQLDVARREYNDPGAVDLILLSGGITNVLVANVVNPFLKRSELIELINQHCDSGMSSLLKRAGRIFPNAKVAVVGYFPIISTESEINQISRYLFKAVKFPHPLQFAFTNHMSKQFMKILRKKMADRSQLWVAESNRAFRNAIDSANDSLGTHRIVFVETPITPENCFGTKDSMLWQTDDRNLPADEMYSTRLVECPKAFDEIKYHHYGKLSLRMCELAAIGHPNIKGSIAYADAIKAKVRPILERSVSDKTRSAQNGGTGGI
jgi:hypothetical protein